MEIQKATKEREEALKPVEGCVRPFGMGRGYEIYHNGQWEPPKLRNMIFSAAEILAMAEKAAYLKIINTAKHENGRIYERIGLIDSRTRETIRDFYIESIESIFINDSIWKGTPS